MLQSTFLVLIGLTAVKASCDNQCNGHGSCLINDVCKCYDNWGLGLSHDSGDCSDRICPFELAWVDHPDKKGAFHKYAECAGRGICDRATGDCTCFDGYEGKACQRTTCPNDCSGHGVCEFIDELTYGATWNDYTNQRFNDESKSFPYHTWDTERIRACVCDATYGDYDCSKKICPYGTDVLDTRDNLLVSTKYQVQQIAFNPTIYHGDAFDSIAHEQAVLNHLSKKTFALTFKTRLNETFTTIPIVFDTSDMNDFVHDIQLALLNLPNRVIDGVSVRAGGLPSATGSFNVTVTFTGASVQGPQHLLIVEDYECAAGCTPRIDGLDLETRIDRLSSNMTEIVLADYNSYECGRRGKCDYTTGLCGCFTGYTGENCDTLTTLV